MLLSKWSKTYNLNIVKKSPLLWLIPEVGTFLLVGNGEREVVDEDFNLILTPEEIKNLPQADYITYQFGNNFYYTEYQGEEDIPAKLQLLAYIGEPNLSDDLNYSNFIHTEYELLNSALNVKQAVKKAKFLKQKSLAMCDKNTLAGALAFQMECKKSDIKHILGYTATIQHTISNENEFNTVKLFVVNERGWQNLLTINRILHRDEDIKYVKEEELLKHTDGLICVFSYEDSILTELGNQIQLKNKLQDKNRYRKIVKTFKNKFKFCFYQISGVQYEVKSQDLKCLRATKSYLNEFAHTLPPVFFDDVFFLEQRHSDIVKKLNQIEDIESNYTKKSFLKTGDQMLDPLLPLFDSEKEYKIGNFEKVFYEGFRNLKKIQILCKYSISTGEHKLPKYEGDKQSDDLFVELVFKGFKEKVKGKVPKEKLKEYRARMERELSVILNAGFEDYFLILWDVVKAQKQEGNYVGISRGSVGGSIVSYLLDITDLDPVKYNLLFERFLNETRVSGERAKSADSLPDIDLDFESAKREDVKKYMSKRFGEHNVCSVGTYNRLKTKSSIKDFARGKGIGFSEVNEVTTHIPDGIIGETFEDVFRIALQKKKEGKTQLYDFIKANTDIIEMTGTILHNPRSSSIHPSAMIITPKEHGKNKDLTVFNWLPTKMMGDKIVSEWEGKYTDRAGFLKEDVLGVSALDKQKYIVDLIKENHNVDIKLRDIPLDDPKVYALFQKGYNEDVFQLNSFGLKNFSKEVQPSDIEHLIAMNALYRPGPMSSNAHKDYVLIKEGKKEPEYDYGLKEVTESTSGLYIYQEQIMRAVHVLGGLSLVESDEVRTVIKKFDKEKMLSFEKKFISGAAKKGCEPEEAKFIWDKLKAFSSYGFNRSHAAGYSIISYHCQWFKANYPLEFWTSALNFGDETVDIPHILKEMRLVSPEIKIKPPDINVSGREFVCNPKENAIYWSINKIKGIGEATSNAILTEREEAGAFFSIKELTQRVPKRNLNKGHFRTLVFAGCFDNMFEIKEETDRLKILLEYENIMGVDYSKDKMLMDKPLERTSFWQNTQKTLIGFGKVNMIDLLIANDIHKRLITTYQSTEVFKKKRHRMKQVSVLIAGTVTKMQEKKTKKGERFMILELSSDDHSIEIFIWLQYLEMFEEQLKDAKTGTLLAITGHKSYYEKFKKNQFYFTNNTKIFYLS